MCTFWPPSLSLIPDIGPLISIICCILFDPLINIGLNHLERIGLHFLLHLGKVMRVASNCTLSGADILHTANLADG